MWYRLGESNRSSGLNLAHHYKVSNNNMQSLNSVLFIFRKSIFENIVTSFL